MFLVFKLFHRLMHMRRILCDRWACAIFITFFLLIHILFVDVFIGITCDAFMSMSHNDGLEVIMRRRHGRATIQRVVFAYIRRQQRRCVCRACVGCALSSMCVCVCAGSAVRVQ